jgi:hypothetical protein
MTFGLLAMPVKPVARAQDGRTIRCERVNGNFNCCAVPCRDIALVRQQSKGACVRGQGWGWVGAVCGWTAVAVPRSWWIAAGDLLPRLIPAGSPAFAATDCSAVPEIMAMVIFRVFSPVSAALRPGVSSACARITAASLTSP